MKRVLIISPKFPPSSSLGAKRALNLVRHLGNHKWEPLILASPENESECDYELNRLLPANLNVSYQFKPLFSGKHLRKKKEIKRSLPLFKRLSARGPYYTPFDQYLWSVPTAILAGRRIIRKYKPRAIIVNADPWSGLLVGHHLSRYAGIPWLADFRDPWSVNEFKMSLRPGIIRFLINRFESMLFNSVAKVVLNTEACCQSYQIKYNDKLEKSRFTYIRNAFDLSVFRQNRYVPENSKFSIHYFGSLRSYMEQKPIFDVFKKFIIKHDIKPDKLEFVLYDDKLDGEYSHFVKELDLIGYIRFAGKVSLHDALLYLKSASILLLVWAPHRQLQIPAKLYDYLAANRPIFAISDNQELNTIIRETSSGVTASYLDPDDCLEKLEYLYFNLPDVWTPNDQAVRQYSVETQIEKYVAVLEEVTKSQE